MGSNINAVRAKKVMREYADDLEGLTNQECAELGISPNSCKILQENLGWGANGILTPEKEKRLIDAGFAPGFVNSLGGPDGKKALHQRVKWLAGHLDYLSRHLETERGLDPNRLRDELVVLDELLHITPDATAAIGALIYVAKDINQIDPARRLAVRALGVMAKKEISDSDAQKIVDTMIRVLNTKSIGLYNDALFALGMMGPRAKVAAPYLAIALNHEEPALRINASFALLSMGPDAEIAVSRLIDALKDGDPRVRENAVGALGSIGPKAQIAVPHIENKLADDDRRMRLNAAWALGQIGQPTTSSIAALEIMAVNDPDPECRAAAKTSLDILKGQTEKSAMAGPLSPQATLLK